METGTERWLPVVGYEGFYEISSFGRVRSLHQGARGRRSGTDIMATHPTTTGMYPMVDLSKAGQRRTCSVHALVAAAFIGPRPPGLDICHKDGNALNPRPENLKYGTRSENILDEIAHGTHRHASRTHCAKGHELTDDNVYRCKARPKTRACRTCRAEWRGWQPPDHSSVESMIGAREAGDILGIAWKSVYIFMKQSPDFPQPTRIRNRLFFDPDALRAWRDRHPTTKTRASH